MNLRKFIAILITVNIIPFSGGFLSYLIDGNFAYMFVGLHILQGIIFILVLIHVGILMIFNR